MKTLSKIVLFMSLLTLPMLVKANPSVAETLSAFAWEKRQILLFAPESQDENYLRFAATLEQQSAELVERKLQVWHLVSGQSVKLGEELFSTELAVTDFQTEYGVAADEFRVILIGYDRGEKLRQDEADIERIFGAIDQMPMRIQEMRQQDADASQ